MKKLLLNSIFLLCALVVGSNAWAGEATASFGPSDFSGQGTSSTGSPISATKSTVTFSCDKGYGTTEIRCYSGGKITISSSNTITAISFTFSGSKTGGMETSYTELSTTSWEQTLSSQARITACTVTYTTDSSDPSSSVAFANASPALDLKDATTYTQVATTANGYTDAGGSVTYSITANSAGATINSSTGEVTLTKAGSVTVQAEAAAVAGHFSASYDSYTLTVTDTRQWDVTCHIGDDESVVKRTTGATLSLDDPEDIFGMSFVGWSSTNNIASPTWVDNSTKVTGNMTLYAMFEAAAGEYSYHLVEANLPDWRGDYLIAYSSSVFANGKTNGESGLGSSSTVKNPSTHLDGKIVDATWGDEYYVSLVAIDDDDLSKGYLLKTQDDYYNYHTNNSGNGINGTSKNKATASTYPITVNYESSSEINLTLDKGQVFRYNTSQGYFRYYKSASYASQGKVYLYKRTADTAPTYSLGNSLGTKESVTIGSSKYASYCSSNALDFSGTDVKAYKAKVNEGKVVLTLVNYVPANEGVILNGDAGNYDVPQIAAAGEVTNNELIGVTSRTLVEWTTGGDGKYNYILQSGQFKKAQTGGYLKANRAYLHTSYDVTTASARDYLEFSFEGEEGTTGVNEVTTTNRTNEYFNLAGQRVAQPTKGLYIVNGKKYVIK